jgi:hypothetical protein
MPKTTNKEKVEFDKLHGSCSDKCYRMKLSKARLNKLLKGENCILSYDELTEAHPDDEEASEFTLYDDSLHKKISQARKTKKSCKLEGGKINWKKVGRVLKTVAKGGMELAKKYIPKDAVAAAVSNGINTGLASVGVEGVDVSPVTDRLVNASYSTDFNKKNAHEDFIKNVISGGTLHPSIDYIQFSNGSILFRNGNPLLKNDKSSSHLLEHNNINTKKIKLAKTKLVGGSFRGNGQ